MSLRHCPLLYVFLETADLAAQRHTIEVDIGLPVIGVDDRPGVRHGVITYDAGTMIVSLNLASRQRFGGGDPNGSDGLVTVFDVPWDGGRSGAITDGNGHHYVLNRVARACRRPTVAELRLMTKDLPSSCTFYRDVLNLALLSLDADHACFAAGAVNLVLERLPASVAHRRTRRDTYLLVFHTLAIRDMCAALSAEGLAFKGRKVGSRDFGSTIHFDDPSGHRFCLYEPSATALATETGRTVRQIVAGCDGLLPIGLR